MQKDRATKVMGRKNLWSGEGFTWLFRTRFFLNAIQTHVTSRLVLLAAVWLSGHLLGGTRQIPVLLRCWAAAIAHSCSVSACSALCCSCHFSVPVLLPLLSRKCIHLPEDEVRGLAEREVT